MAHKDKHNRGRKLEGQVHGSRGATYFVTTDANGVISCSCPSWLFKQKAAIQDRVCKHLSAVFASGKIGQVTGKQADAAANFTARETEAREDGKLVRKITFEED